MSNLETFLSSKFIIKRGTDEHDQLVKCIEECFDSMKHATVLITKESQLIKAVGVTEPTLEKPQGSLTVARVTAVPFPVRIAMSHELLEDRAVDTLGYVLMVAARAIGNFLLAESLDGDGEIVVRFANNFDVEVRRVRIDDKLVTFDVIAYCGAARHKALKEGEHV